MEKVRVGLVGSAFISTIHVEALKRVPSAQIIAATGDIVLAMIFTTSVPLILYGCLIGAVRERSHGDQ